MIASAAWLNRQFAVLGLARSGLASVAALIAGGARVIAWDDRDDARDAAAALGAQLADPLASDLSGYAAVVVSPGVPLNRHPIAGHARAAGVPVVADTELFAHVRAELPPHRVVGITGTNGKSTVTALIHHILSGAGVPSLMGGNIGLPILSRDPLPAGGVYVLELSSYQIDLTATLDCDVAVLTNVTPDHLDRYDFDFGRYVAAKERLFAMQSADARAGGQRLALFNADDVQATSMAARTPGSVLTCGGDADPAFYGHQADWPGLQGPHNVQNAALAIAACRWLGVGDGDIARGLATYASLPHRMEFVGQWRGIRFYNDSKATNGASAAPAVAAFPPAPHRRLHWIVGGQAKDDGIGPVEPWFGNIAHAYAIGEAGSNFADVLGARVPVTISGTVERAVADVIANARSGDVVLLSPACASFDQFRDFEARGDAFRAAVTHHMGEPA